MTNDDVIHRSRLRLFALAGEVGSVRAACRLMGVHHSTYYRWRRQLVRFGPELLRPRERRQPRMPSTEPRSTTTPWPSSASSTSISAPAGPPPTAVERVQQTSSASCTSTTQTAPTRPPHQGPHSRAGSDRPYLMVLSTRRRRYLLGRGHTLGHAWGSRSSDLPSRLMLRARD